MGKKRGTASSGATASAPKASLDWVASTISMRDEKKMRSLRLISSVESNFVHQVCKAYLGIDPHWGLWRKISYVKRHSGNDDPHMVSSVGFIVRNEVNYFNFPMKESVQGLRQKWFYLRDNSASGRRSNLSRFEDVLVVVPKKSWQNTLTAEESEVADQLYENILDLKNAGGTTLSTALDSPSVISQLVSPPQASRVGTSAESENCFDNFGDASTVLDDNGSLGPFLDATIAWSRQIENTEIPNENTVTHVNSPESVEHSSDDPDEDYVELDDDFIDKCNATTGASTAKKIENHPKALMELYLEVTNDDDRTIQRGKIRNIQLPAIRYSLATSILGRENTSNISSYHLAFLVAALTGSTPYHLGALIARRLSNKGPIYGGIVASRIVAYLGLSVDPSDEKLIPIKLDIAAMKGHQFVTTNSNLENIVYRMLFIDGDERKSLCRSRFVQCSQEAWSRSKEEVDEQLRILGFHQQHDSEDAEPSDGYTVTYPGASSSLDQGQDPPS
ncbi:hypothetical protein QYE76_056174 [Lolium multiflorum]|uniref:Uncharacterized protein n=1 Tax=Lolium multiflorum TaxID=4521 RepID=A0AAD8T1Z7_LOLMU|nr:hypothetical protein QYE76_056174 [Lolium multiflorum]